MSVISMHWGQNKIFAIMPVTISSVFLTWEYLNFEHEFTGMYSSILVSSWYQIGDRSIPMDFNTMCRHIGPNELMRIHCKYNEITFGIYVYRRGSVNIKTARLASSYWSLNKKMIMFRSHSHSRGLQSYSVVARSVMAWYVYYINLCSDYARI